MCISRLISVVYHESAKTLNLALSPREDDEDAGTLSLRSDRSKKKNIVLSYTLQGNIKMPYLFKEGPSENKMQNKIQCVGLFCFHAVVS